MTYIPYYLKFFLTTFWYKEDPHYTAFVLQDSAVKMKFAAIKNPNKHQYDKR